MKHTIDRSTEKERHHNIGHIYFDFRIIIIHIDNLVNMIGLILNEYQSAVVMHSGYYIQLWIQPPSFKFWATILWNCICSFPTSSHILRKKFVHCTYRPSHRILLINAYSVIQELLGKGGSTSRTGEHQRRCHIPLNEESFIILWYSLEKWKKWYPNIGSDFLKLVPR